MTTISSSTTVGIFLTTASYTSPVYIESGVSITTSTGDAMSASRGSGMFWTVMNHGTVSGFGAGIYLGAGGSVTNVATASVSGEHGGVQIYGAGTVINDSSIASLSGDGVDLFTGGYVTNAASATITGFFTGVYINKGIGTVVNNGSITGGAAGSAGVDLNAGGSVTNEASASITGLDGITGALTVTNDGSIAGSSGYGVDLFTGGGSVTNAAGASIIGSSDGVFGFTGDGTVVNDGSIAGNDTHSGWGVHVHSGTITNAAAASITGGHGGVFLSMGGTLINAGTIEGSGGTAVYLGGTANNRLVVEPSAVFSGSVTGSPSASNTLELASAVSVGMVTGLGTEFTNFNSIEFDAGSGWFISGNTSGLAGTISGFAFLDTIEVTGITATGSSYVGGVLTLTEASGSATLNLPGTFTTSEFVVTNGTAGADVSLAVPCFVAGTRIRTERGAVAVEALQVGDLVPVVMGGNVQPIVWLGHRSIDCRRHREPRLVRPVRICTGAFGPRQPHRDLFLSPDHAVFVAGVLIPVKHLINGGSIAQVPVAFVDYFHVELPCHAVLLAEGLPVESYLAVGDRANFANGGEQVRLHPDFSTLTWEASGCAPLVMSGPQLDAARARLAANAMRRLARKQRSGTSPG
jgi:Hint domain